MGNKKTLASILEAGTNMLKTGRNAGLAASLAAVGAFYNPGVHVEGCDVAGDLNQQKVFWGGAIDGECENPVKIDYYKIVKATPAYRSIKKDRIESGTPKYWILMSKASDQAVSYITMKSKEMGYDLVVSLSEVNSDTFPDCHETIEDRTKEMIDWGKKYEESKK